MPSNPLRAALVLSLVPVLVHCNGELLSIGSDDASAPVTVVDRDGGAASGDSGDDAHVNADSSVHRDAGTPSGDEQGIVLCQFGMPDAGVVPPGATTATYADDCNVNSDCAIGNHLEDCCGSKRALGIRASEQPRFTASGGLCGSEFGMCNCPAAPPRADDGEASQFADGRDIVASCVAGACRTHVATFQCGNQRCDSQSEFCEIFPPGITVPDGGTSASGYACSTLPTACASNPTCACVTGSSTNVQSCADPNAHVTITHFGI
jgi:hypothetical protein